MYLQKVDLRNQKLEWRPFAHVPIDHQPLIALEQWKGTGCYEWL